MSEFTDDIKAQIEESNIRLSSCDDNEWAVDVIDSCLDEISRLETLSKSMVESVIDRIMVHSDLDIVRHIKGKNSRFGAWTNITDDKVLSMIKEPTDER